MTGMKKMILALTVAILASTGNAWADTTLSFAPTPADLSDLDHYQAYRWGFDVALPEDEEVVSASLTIFNIRNWDNNPNVLYIHLLDWTQLGVRQATDNEGGGDYFATYGYPHTPLVTYQNLPTTAQTLVYDFTPAQVSALNSYLADGRIGLGFDPDCHFYNDGVQLTVTTPEPAAWALLLGTIPMILRRRIGA